jgi:phosphoribosyl-AMP cyclohydrolase
MGYTEWDYERKREWLWNRFETEREKVEYWEDILADCDTDAQKEAAQKNIDYYTERALAFQKNYQDFLNSYAEG